MSSKYNYTKEEDPMMFELQQIRRDLSKKFKELDASALNKEADIAFNNWRK